MCATGGIKQIEAPKRKRVKTPDRRNKLDARDVHKLLTAKGSLQKKDDIAGSERDFPCI